MGRIIDSEKMNLVGKRVRQFRIEQNLSQRELSIKLETIAVYICRGSISRIEDQTRTVSDIELYGLSQVLNKPIENFFETIILNKNHNGSDKNAY